ncbi:MAG: hypothetical protein JST00_12990 [Deltaproteobacteria bacterium]|nr:hypothetical protein [Deltaproteobacteria bacterium]
MRQQTVQRVASPTAILVNVPEPAATAVADVLAQGGLKVLRVGHVAAACERIPVTMPQLVVLPSTLRPEEAESITERCVAVGATVFPLDVNADPATVAPRLKQAAHAAMIRTLRRGTAG